MTADTHIIIFTDLDGTFLDHHTYTYDALMPALKRLKKSDVPIIAVTSKTMAEIQDLKLPLHQTVMVSENGMAITGFDGQSRHEKSHADILDFISNLPDGIRAHIKGFDNMSIEEVSQYTDLPLDKAKLAKTRQASEPFLWSGDDTQMQILQELAQNKGLNITRGGRFYHLISPGGKAQAVTMLLQQYKHIKNTDRIISISLGDGANDAAMLAVTDYGVKIPNDQSGYDFTVENPAGKIIEATQLGPAGWNQAINSILDQLRL